MSAILPNSGFMKDLFVLMTKYGPHEVGNQIRLMSQNPEVYQAWVEENKEDLKEITMEMVQEYQFQKLGR